MISIDVKYKTWDFVCLVWWEERMRVIWYEYVEWRWLRYILMHGHDWQYQYEMEIQLYTQKHQIWFVPPTE